MQFFLSLTRSTLNTGGWDCRHCCVHPQAVEGRGLSGVIKTRHLRPSTPSRLPETTGGVLGERWLCSMIPSFSKPGLALSSLGYSSTAGKGILAFLRRDIRARLHHCWANSLVNVCDAVLKGVKDHSRGVLTEMRAARDLHTVSRTLQHSCARAGQKGAELANALTDVAMAVTYALSRAMKSHTSVLHGILDPLPGQAKSCSAFPIIPSL